MGYGRDPSDGRSAYSNMISGAKILAHSTVRVPLDFLHRDASDFFKLVAANRAVKSCLETLAESLVSGVRPAAPILITALGAVVRLRFRRVLVIGEEPFHHQLDQRRGVAVVPRRLRRI